MHKEKLHDMLIDNYANFP